MPQRPAAENKHEASLKGNKQQAQGIREVALCCGPPTALAEGRGTQADPQHNPLYCNSKHSTALHCNEMRRLNLLLAPAQTAQALPLAQQKHGAQGCRCSATTTTSGGWFVRCCVVGCWAQRALTHSSSLLSSLSARPPARSSEKPPDSQSPRSAIPLRLCIVPRPHWGRMVHEVKRSSGSDVCPAGSDKTDLCAGRQTLVAAPPLLPAAGSYPRLQNGNQAPHASLT